MGADDASNWMPHTPVAVDIATKPVGWRLADVSASKVQPHTEIPHLKQHNDPSPGWSAVQLDFERRLCRFGIKISDESDKSAVRNSAESIPVVPATVGTYAIVDDSHRHGMPRSFANPTLMTSDYPPCDAPTMACFTNNRNESRFERLEQQLRQARTETQIWKDKSDAREHDLRASYKETMEWRMKYEDLYSSIIQDRHLRSQELPGRRGGTKSSG